MTVFSVASAEESKSLDALERWSESHPTHVAIFGAAMLVYVGLRVGRGFEHYDMWMLARNLSQQQVLPAGFDPFTLDPFDPETGRQYEAGVKFQPPGRRSQA